MNGFTLALAALATVLICGTFWFRLAFQQALPEKIWAFVLAMAVSLLLAIAAFFQGPGLLGGIAAGFALVASVFFLGSTYAGKQKIDEAKIAVGKPLPSFSALRDDGTAFSSDELSGTPYLLKFFRGHW